MKYTIIFLLLFVSNSIAYACDCISITDFKTGAPKQPFVALIKIKKFLTFVDVYGKQAPTSMEVEIIEILKGVENRKTIVIWGDSGNDCRPYLSIFDKEYYIMALEKTNKDATSDYDIPSCGQYWLGTKKRGRRIIGLSESGKIKFKELKQLFSKK